MADKSIVVQPWDSYPPAIATVRVLNTIKSDDPKVRDQITVMFLESFWVYGQKLFSEDDLLVLDGTYNTKVSLGSGGDITMRLMNSPNLTFQRPEKGKYGLHKTRVKVTKEEAVKWNKELLRSQVMDEAEYMAFLGPIGKEMEAWAEDMVSDAGSSSDWDEMDEDMIMDDIRDEAEDFVRLLTPEQIIRLNHIYTGDTINDYKNAADPEKMVQIQLNETVDYIMEEVYISDGAIYEARVSHRESLRDSAYDNWRD